MPHISSNSSSSCFLDINLHELYELNRVHNHLNNYLDLVLSNSASAACRSVYPASSLLLPQDAHHPALEIALQSSLFRASRVRNVLPSAPNSLSVRYNFRLTDYRKLNSIPSRVDWSFLSMYIGRRGCPIV